MFEFALREDAFVRLSQRFLAFLLVLLYAAMLVAGCFFIWSLEQLDATWRLIMVGLSVIGWSWSLSEGMRPDQLLSRSGKPARKQESG